MSWYSFGYFLSQCVAKGYFRLKVHGRENLIEDGRALIASNHQSYIDPPFVGICCKKPVHFLARKSLLNWPVLGPIFPKINVVPVDQERADMSALKAVIRLMKEGKRTLIFPEGSRTLNGELQPAQPGIGLIIHKSRAPVIPVRISGAYEAFPRGSKFPRPKPVTIHIGKPIRYDQREFEGSGRVLYQSIAEEVMQAIADLPTSR